ncbi:hypothetical protein J6590_103545, partial [Homalodisca vitripennis]
AHNDLPTTLNNDDWRATGELTTSALPSPPHRRKHSWLSPPLLLPPPRLNIH